MIITGGKINKPQKVVIYGPEGIGKSTFAAQFPNPLFIDTEDGTRELAVDRTHPADWQELLDTIEEFGNDLDNLGYKTLVIDTADWAERMCIETICRKAKKSGIEDFGYGKGYTYVQEEFGRMLNELGKLIDRDVNIVVLAHAKMRTFQQPDEMGSYDRWEMKLSKQVAPLLKEWGDMVLFLNYKTIVVSQGDNLKAKAQGGQRVMYTSHHPCWDAKNRHGLKEEMPLDEGVQAVLAIIDRTKPKHERLPEMEDPWKEADKPQELSKDTMKELYRLITADGLTLDQVCRAVEKKGYYEPGTPFHQYAPDFIEQVLVGAWEQIKKFIADNNL